MMEPKIETIEVWNNKAEFDIACNDKLTNGWTLRSSNCGFNGFETSVDTIYQAIFMKG